MFTTVRPDSAKFTLYDESMEKEMLNLRPPKTMGKIVNILTSAIYSWRRLTQKRGGKTYEQFKRTLSASVCLNISSDWMIELLPAELGPKIKVIGLRGMRAI